ncbi:hypothetical protein G9C98_003312 [Cotesia typhae]|uniref:EB domain-containing protein n=1 Tax=Cotesia typhae TaxID=2053667 RepID=A0A8J5QQ58_9HYME|nr:hypothetical protein G9C98_003312 [Cotesia typhae]
MRSVAAVAVAAAAAAAAACNPLLYRPCCDFDNQCKSMGWGSMSNTFLCTKSSNLNSSCEYNLDCLHVDYTMCAEGRCKCLPNYIQVNSFTCASFLGGFCKNNETCIALNSTCIDNKCQCNPSFVPKTYRECVQTPVGTYCTYDSDCTEKLRQTKCSENKKCICKEEIVTENGLECL